MLYDIEKTIESIRWIDKWFSGHYKNSEEFSPHRLARLFEVEESFVTDVLEKKIYPDVPAMCHIPCMLEAVRTSEWLGYTTESSEEADF